MTFREASAELLRLAEGIRDVAARLDGTDRDRQRVSANLRAVAYDLELQARKAAVAATRAGEPE